MSLIRGNVNQITKQPAQTLVSVRPLSKPVVVGGAIIWPETKVVRSDALGAWSVTLAMGDYELVVGDAKVTISVPHDDLTYDFTARIVGAVVYSPTAPVGGAQPNASTAVFGLVRVDTDSATPIAVTGVFLRDTIAAMKVITSQAANKLCVLCKPGAGVLQGTIYYWDPASAAADDGMSVIIPNDAPANGRWVQLI